MCVDEQYVGVWEKGRRDVGSEGERWRGRDELLEDGACVYLNRRCVGVLGEKIRSVYFE